MMEDKAGVLMSFGLPFSILFFPIKLLQIMLYRNGGKQKFVSHKMRANMQSLKNRGKCVVRCQNEGRNTICPFDYSSLVSTMIQLLNCLFFCFVSSFI